MTKNKIMVVGCNGRMGSVVADVLKNKGYIVAEVNKDTNYENFEVDLVVDFSVAENTEQLAKWCLKKKVPLVIGTTGHSKQQLEQIENAAKQIPVLKAGNFSMGMLIFKKNVKNIIKFNPKEIVVFEKHHRNKKDSPSGTAVELKKYIENFWQGNVCVLAERGGKEVGEHVVNFYFENEVVSLKHVAYSRECFADGVLQAIEFMQVNKRVKMFEFDDIFE